MTQPTQLILSPALFDQLRAGGFLVQDKPAAGQRWSTWGQTIDDDGNVLCTLAPGQLCRVVAAPKS